MRPSLLTGLFASQLAGDRSHRTAAHGLPGCLDAGVGEAARLLPLAARLGAGTELWRRWACGRDRSRRRRCWTARQSARRSTACWRMCGRGAVLAFSLTAPIRRRGGPDAGRPSSGVPEVYGRPTPVLGVASWATRRSRASVMFQSVRHCMGACPRAWWKGANVPWERSVTTWSGRPRAAASVWRAGPLRNDPEPEAWRRCCGCGC
jgi:hypothetical protein